MASASGFIQFLTRGYQGPRIWPKRLGEVFFVLSYLFLLVFFLQLFRRVIFEEDARRLFVVLQIVGHVCGATRLGLPAFWRLISPRLTQRKLHYVLTWITWSSIWGVIAVLRHWGFRTMDLDLGTYGQAIHGTSIGKWYFDTLAPFGGLSVLNDHQVYTMALFAPLYWAPWGTELLLFIQAFLLLSPGFFVGLWVRKRWGTPGSWVTMLTYCSFAPLMSNILWDFHETAWSTPFLAFWSIALIEGWAPGFFFASIFLGLTKEHLLIVTLPGILVFLWTYRNKYSRRTLFLGLGFLVLAWQLWLFRYNQTHWARVLYIRQYEQFGTSFGEIARSMILHPGLVLKTLFTTPKFVFFITVFLPLLFAPFFAGRFVFAWLPVLAIYLLSGREDSTSLSSQYIMDVWSVLLVPATVGWMWFHKKIKSGSALLVPAILIAAIWQGPPTPLVVAKTHYNFARACMKSRLEFREEIRKIAAECSGEAIGIGGGWYSTYAQIYDLTTAFSDRQADDFPYRNLDDARCKTEKYRKQYLSLGYRARGSRLSCRSEPFLKAFSSSRCRYISGSPSMSRIFLDELPGRYVMRKRWEACHPEGIEIWMGQNP